MANFPFTKFRGLADSKWSGIEGAFPKMVGLDIHSTPGTITVNQKLSLHSSTVITEFCKVALSVSDGSRLWFSSDSGKIWRESGGTYTLKHITTPAAGSAACLGAEEFNGVIYFATQSRLHKISVSEIGNAWVDGGNVTENFGTFDVTDSEFHPMVANLNAGLFIGDGNQVAKVVAAGTFSSNVLDIEAPHRIKCMAPFDVDLIIGTIIASTVNSCKVIRWDTVETSWQYAPDIEENGINAFIDLGTLLLAQAGRSGNLYFYNGVTLEPYKRIPGTWTPSKTGLIHPNSIGRLKGIPVFGFSNVSGNPADQGIYSIGSYSKDYPIVINGPEFIISQDKVATIELGAILVEDLDLYVAWKDGSNYGVDKLDYSNKYASAYIEFPVITSDPSEFSTFIRYLANYFSMPSGTSLTFKYDKNHSGSFTTFTNTAADQTDKFQVIVDERITARVFQLRVEFTVSSNSAPIVESFLISDAN